jgi:hypothetical protein
MPMRTLMGMLSAFAVLFAGACTTSSEPPAPVTDAEATAAFDELFSIASRRTPDAMGELCELSTEPCPLFGMSGVVVHDPLGPSSAPTRDDRPAVLCSRAVPDDAWMLVVEGRDGLDREYVSQMVFARDEDGRVVAAREPAFWLGVGYSSEPKTGAASWSTAYGPSSHTDPAHTERVLADARRGCES